IRRSDQCGVEDNDVSHPPHRAREEVAAGARVGGGHPALPAALALCRDDVEAARHTGTGLGGSAWVCTLRGVKRTGDCRLLDHGTVVAGMQAVDERAYGTRILHHLLQILPGPHLARRKLERGLFEAGVDQELFEGSLVLDVLHRLAARDLVERRLGYIEMATLDQFRHLSE